MLYAHIDVLLRIAKIRYEAPRTKYNINIYYFEVSDTRTIRKIPDTPVLYEVLTLRIARSSYEVLTLLIARSSGVFKILLIFTDVGCTSSYRMYRRLTGLQQTCRE